MEEEISQLTRVNSADLAKDINRLCSEYTNIEVLIATISFTTFHGSKLMDKEDFMAALEDAWGQLLK